MVAAYYYSGFKGRLMMKLTRKERAMEGSATALRSAQNDKVGLRSAQNDMVARCASYLSFCAPKLSSCAKSQDLPKSWLKATTRFLLGALLTLPLAAQALTPISDSQMSDITGQALLTSDYIAPNGLPVADPNSSLQGGNMPIGFYRMGLDATVSTNLNINKLQLGCGGFNNNIKMGCDIDLDYVSMMGLSAAQGGSGGQPETGQLDATGSTNYNKDAGEPAISDFVMKRPFISIAVAYPNDPTKREVVGFEFGAQSVTGYMGIGRVYQYGEVNEETGETCSESYPIGCHSGLNSLSGYMHVTLSGGMPLTGSALGGIAPINSGSNACFGAIDYGNCSTSDPEATTNITGTRINTMLAQTIAKSHVVSLFGITLDIPLIATLNENLRFIHGFAVRDTGNFFLSFQRQQLAWPKYDKTGYAHIANAGWWMNIPNVFATGIVADTVTVDAPGIPSSITLGNIELKSVPPINCYGGYQFC